MTRQYPWMIGSIPSYAPEAAIFADYLKENKPDAKVAILAQNDDFGEAYVVAFKKAIEGTDITVVAEQKYKISQPRREVAGHHHGRSGADTVVLGDHGPQVPARR